MTRQWKLVAAACAVVTAAGACARSNGGGRSNATASAAAGAPPTAQSFVGLQYPPFPEGLDEQGGTMLAVGGKTEFALNVVSRDSTTYVWLSRLTERNAEGEPGFEVRAALRVPSLDSGEVLLVGRCRMAGAADVGDRGIVAIARTAGHEADPELNDIRKAWRADVTKEAFRELPADSVVCANEVLQG